MAERSSIIQSNYWHKPGILVRFVHEDTSPEGSIHVDMDADDFLRGLLQEMIHPMKIWTEKSLETAIRTAYNKTLEKAKESTRQVM